MADRFAPEYVPECPFCRKKVQSWDKDVFDEGKHFHELCWWKRECARLTAEVDRLKDAPDGSYSQSLRPAVVHGDLESDPTQLAIVPPEGEPV